MSFSKRQSLREQAKTVNQIIGECYPLWFDGPKNLGENIKLQQKMVPVEVAEN